MSLVFSPWFIFERHEMVNGVPAEKAPIEVQRRRRAGQPLQCIASSTTGKRCCATVTPREGELDEAVIPYCDAHLESGDGAVKVAQHPRCGKILVARRPLPRGYRLVYWGNRVPCPRCDKEDRCVSYYPISVKTGERGAYNGVIDPGDTDDVMQFASCPGPNELVNMRSTDACVVARARAYRPLFISVSRAQSARASSSHDRETPDEEAIVYRARARASRGRRSSDRAGFRARRGAGRFVDVLPIRPRYYGARNGTLVGLEFVVTKPIAVNEQLTHWCVIGRAARHFPTSGRVARAARPVAARELARGSICSDDEMLENHPQL